MIYPLERVPDPVFSQKLAGDGISIDPTDNILRAPCPGEIVQQHAAGHAVTLKTAGDLEVLMHVGIDTVTLKGKGFTPRVKIGDRVDTGAALIEFDLDYVATNAKSLLTEVIISNGERVTQHCLWNRHSCRRQDPGVDLDVGRRSGGSGDRNRPDRYFGGSHSAKSERFACSARSRIEQRSQDVQERCPPPTRRSFCERAQCHLAAGSRDGAGRQGRDWVAKGPDAKEAVGRLTPMIAEGLGDEGCVPATALAAMNAAPISAPAPTKAGDPNLIVGVAASSGLAVGEVYQVRHVDIQVKEEGRQAGPGAALARRCHRQGGRAARGAARSVAWS